MIRSIRFILTFLLAHVMWATLAIPKNVKGIVYLDENQNLVRDAGERVLEDVLVSNGRDVVKTNQKGEWELKLTDQKSFFVIQPPGYIVPVNDAMVPQHYRILNNPTNNREFPLWTDDQHSDNFEALLFGDTQARGIKEVNYVMHDVVEECIGSTARFGVALGDIVADDPELFDEISQGIGKIGVPWYYVFGNHDHDRGVKGNEGAEDTFIKNFGPSTYAFAFGKVCFVSLNNVDFKEEGGYRAHFSDDQIEFVRQLSDQIPDDHLIVLMMHIPIVACDNKEDIFRTLEQREYSLTIAGHTHTLINAFLDEEYGWNGEKPHHMFVNGTVSGSWWCGIKDELGIPHTTMNDGAPNGYATIRFEGNQYSIRYKAARRPADYQMNIYLPDDILLTCADTTQVLVNFFNGTSRSKLRMRVDEQSGWLELEQTETRDPANIEMYELSPVMDMEYKGSTLDETLGWKMDYPSKSSHFWQGKLPANLGPGTHLLEVRATDFYGQTFTAHRIFRINK